jgi:hypothetical protein
MVNAWPSVVSGLSKRPPTVWHKNLGMSAQNAMGYIIDRDTSYRYIVVVVDDDLKVFDINGNAQTVSFPDGKGYLDAASPIDSFKFVTVGDTTFVLNREKAVLSTADYEPASPTRINPTSRVTFYVTNSIPNANYNIYINGSLVGTFLTGTNTDAASAVESTIAIASALRSDLIAAGYTVTQTGSTITVSGISSTASIVTNSSNGDKILKWYRDEVASFSDLPPSEVPNRVVRVKGDVSSAEDDYYVQYVNGIWTETVQYGKKAGLDRSTMPHVLIRNSDGTWTFQRHIWSERIAGDNNSNPHPSFVGFKLRDIFLNSNRLGLVSEENVIMSETNEYENFYRTTLTALLDSDPIDLAVLHNSVNILQHAIPYNENILLFSDQNQFRYSYDGFLGPKNVKTQFTTSFNCSRRVAPLNIGGSIYFVDDQTNTVYGRVMEYYPKDNQTGDDADEISAAVPEYINGPIKWAAGTSSSKSLFLSDGSNTVWVHKWFWAGDRKVQNAWGKWTFPGATAIVWASIAQERLYMLIRRDGTLNLESVSLKEDVFTSSAEYTPLFDRQASAASISYNSATDETTITTPYAGTTVPQVVATIGALKNLLYPVVNSGNDFVTVSGDLTGATVLVGYPYEMKYVFSPFYIRQAKGNGEAVVLDGRLQVRYLILEYHDTFYFKTEVAAPGRDTSIMEFTGQTIGSVESVLGDVSFPSGAFRVPVMGENIKTIVTLKNDSPYPCFFGSAEVLAQYYPKAARRV